MIQLVFFFTKIESLTLPIVRHFFTKVKSKIIQVKKSFFTRKNGLFATSVSLNDIGIVYKYERLIELLITIHEQNVSGIWLNAV